MAALSIIRKEWVVFGFFRWVFCLCLDRLCATSKRGSCALASACEGAKLLTLFALWFAHLHAFLVGGSVPGGPLSPFPSQPTFQDEGSTNSERGRSPAPRCKSTSNQTSFQTTREANHPLPKLPTNYPRDLRVNHSRFPKEFST